MSHNVYGLYSTGCYIIILSEEVSLDIGYFTKTPKHIENNMYVTFYNHLIRGCKQVLY